MSDRKPPKESDDPVDPAERARAEQLADQLDRQDPIASPVDSELASLLAVAEVIRASAAQVGSTAQNGAVGKLVHQAIDQVEATAQAQRRWRGRRWRIALASAAALLLVAGASLGLFVVGGAEGDLAAASFAGSVERFVSRSSDALLGTPITERAAASARLDRVFADRLDGYRMISTVVR
ncbi:MAG: hypothetical protein H6707_05380 [Deltaproteobacteria bacterium]|nr:hypothetical protein [Deltaproteobacteria bacterium]